MVDYKIIAEAGEKLSRLCSAKDRQLEKELGSEYENYFTDALNTLVEHINEQDSQIRKQSEYIKALEGELE